MKVGLDVSKMHNLSKSRGIGYYAQNLYDSIKKYTDTEIKIIEKEENYNNFDLIHFPFFDFFKHTLPSKVSKPFVVTIHDLIPLQFSSHYPPGIKGKFNLWRQKQSLKNAKSIISVSETVKKDIHSIFKIPSNKIHPVYSAASLNYQPIKDQKILMQIKQKYKLPDEFVLYIGNVNWNKNILNTTEACLRAGKKLVIVGSSFLDKSSLDHPEKKSHKQFLSKYENSDLIRLLGYVPEEDLVGILNLSTCMIYVSFYEGFGLPILEAQSCAVPVITSNTSATFEISEKSALHVNPDNVEEISTSITKLFSSPDLRKELSKKGLENAKKFTWEKTAKETVKVYNASLA